MFVLGTFLIRPIHFLAILIAVADARMDPAWVLKPAIVIQDTSLQRLVAYLIVKEDVLMGSVRLLISAPAILATSLTPSIAVLQLVTQNASTGSVRHREFAVACLISFLVLINSNAVQFVRNFACSENAWKEFASVRKDGEDRIARCLI